MLLKLSFWRRLPVELITLKGLYNLTGECTENTLLARSSVKDERHPQRVCSVHYLQPGAGKY